MLSSLLFSCKDVKESVNEIPDPFHGPEKIVNIDTLLTIKQALKTDTLLFEKTKEFNHVDKILAIQLKKGYTKDSIEITSCRLDFYHNNKIVNSIPVTTYASSEEGDWSLYEDALGNDKSKKSDYRFFEISYGVGACGYVQSNFLFFVENNNFQLIVQYDSMGDGPYGNGLEFEPNFDNNKIVSFSSKSVSIESDDSKPYNDENEDLVRTFSDSTIYTYDDGKWSGRLKTKKGKPYRKEFRTFHELYKQE